MRHAILGCVVAALAVGSRTAVLPAASVAEPTFAELVRESAVIFVGRVSGVQPIPADAAGRRLIFTDVSFTVTSTLKGSDDATRVLRFLGGTLGADALIVPGMPRFAVGDRTLAITLIHWRGTSILESDVLFNRGRSFNSYRGPARSDVHDFRRVAAHEFGHVLGLDHPDDDGQTVVALMNSTIRIGSAIEAPQADDVNGLRPLYGSASAPPAPTPIVIAFPPRDQTLDFRHQLEVTYRDGLRRTPSRGRRHDCLARRSRAPSTRLACPVAVASGEVVRHPSHEGHRARSFESGRGPLTAGAGTTSAPLNDGEKSARREKNPLARLSIPNSAGANCRVLRAPR